MADLNIRISVTPKMARWGLTVSLLALLGTNVSPESTTLNTYYPAPSGIYVNMITTGDTYLARTAGTQVGIGTTAPQKGTALDVVGSVSIHNPSGIINANNANVFNPPVSSIAPTSQALQPGSIYYDNTKQWQGYNGTGWVSLGGLSGCISTPGSGSIGAKNSSTIIGYATCQLGTQLTAGGCDISDNGKGNPSGYALQASCPASKQTLSAVNNKSKNLNSFCEATASADSWECVYTCPGGSGTCSVGNKAVTAYAYCCVP